MVSLSKRVLFFLFSVFLSIIFSACAFTPVSDNTEGSYTVTYNGNGNTSGNVPIGEKRMKKDDVFVMAKNTGKLVKDGYCFGGWSEDANSQEGLFYGGENFIVQKDTIFYAIWQKEIYVSADKAIDLIKDLSSDVTICIQNDITEEKLVALGTAIQNMGISEYKVNINIKYTSLTKIPDKAFSGCTQLASIVLPLSITTIGDSAFACSGISSFNRSSIVNNNNR